MVNKENIDNKVMNDFDSWNEVKKQVDAENAPPDRFPKEGEVWMIVLGKNIGFEQNGSGGNFSRPVVIIKKFNNHMFWAVPLSTKQKKFDFYFNYTDPNNQNVSAILAQMKLISVKRLKRKIYDIETALLDNLKRKLRSYF